MINIIEFEKDRKFLKKLLSRSQFEFYEVNKVVDEILIEVNRRKDEAVREYTSKFDGVLLENFLVSDEEIDNAFNNIDKNLKEDLVKAKINIEKYHNKQIRNSYTFYEGEDIILGQIVNPIEKVGIYVPGGSAAYPSTVLMNAVPAKIAGVKEIIMITPPNKHGKIKDSILVAASIAGVDKIYKVGGAQGIGALTFGTETIAKVDKIVGPGNIYVAMAKRKVSGYVGIDMVAGPSEILIIGDRYTNAKYVAADLISQAEHDEMAAPILVTSSQILARNVVKELEIQVNALQRKDIIKKSLQNYGAIIITTCLSKSIDIANEIAPEHLEILTKNPFDIYRRIKNAGAIFIGEYSPEPVGDYFAGTNHTLPTSSTARFSSPLSVDDFIKKTSLVYYSREALRKSKDSIIRIAEDEGLTAHANSIKVRFQEE
ncbi:histidinol dehydrogenase [Clostridium tetanomorphum]|uniref:histidinol dehydrogenase n=1 Tax=Clostridium tetanomorphum TaxID=1553 RepID=UPI00044EF071|nr:histidinol dehydrogenase [Clostridium tetanomorphum]KAJ49817.1 histidinol dehydrogenase HisD [Clostridium tetanomorphum DSM 665]MBP1865119.1 histidinol dehydrogenase [Clostridium tetanomorphum]NRS84742.1 histidinol dehydrogenase [Clostridium tetanomorphum]SQB91756.1 histidinol dehydrogenase HisD [Clostridium tetanomorphum]